MRATILLTALLAAAPGEAQPRATDTDAFAALDRMVTFLRQQQSFTVRLRMSTDYVLGSGQKVRLDSTGDLRVQRPNRLRADVVSDREDRELYDDGLTFTINAPQVGYFAQVPAAPTILRTADMLQDRYGLEVPMIDLLRWGSGEPATEPIRSGIDVGPATIDGIATEQYAFRQRGLDWQIWIQRGEQPLPIRLVLTTTDDPARPERTVDLRWQLNARHSVGDFAFAPASNSRPIQLVDGGGAASGARTSIGRGVHRAVNFAGDRGHPRPSGRYETQFAGDEIRYEVAPKSEQ